MTWLAAAFWLVGGIVLATCKGAPPFVADGARPQALLLDDFDTPVQNRLGGYRNPFQRSPSSASARRLREAGRPRVKEAMDADPAPHISSSDVDIPDASARRGLRIIADRKNGGFCGYWLHLFDFKSQSPTYVDARPFRFLSFWVKGERGGERFTIKLADRAWVAKEDGVEVGDVAGFLPNGVTREWQEVLVPIGLDTRINWRELAGVTLDFRTPGQSVVMIDDLSLKAAEDVPTPFWNGRLYESDGVDAAAVEIDSSGRSNTQRNRVQMERASPPRAMWIWDASPLFDSDDERRQLWELCGDQRIDTLWIQLQYDLHDTSGEPTTAGDSKTSASTKTIPSATIRDESSLAKLIAEAHSHGIKVHALDGLPEYALRENHGVPLAVVDAVIAFNAARDAAKSREERFDGVHFDNEPHLLIGWHDPNQRESILREFLELNAECQRRCDSRPELDFGVDIPFWWQYADDSATKAVEPIGAVTFNGKRQSADRHCIELLDNVGVMNYRDTADGADGMIAHARQLLRWADKADHARLYLGVETFAYEPTDVWFLLGKPRDEFFAALRGPAGKLARHSRVRGFRLRLFDDGERIHVGVELPPAAAGESANQNERTAASILARLAGHFSAGGSSDSPDTMAALRHLAEKLEADPEWSRTRGRAIPVDADSPDSPSMAIGLPGVVAESVMLGKITFAEESPAEMLSQWDEADEYFRSFDTYAGLAIHYYDTFRGKLRRTSDTTYRKSTGPPREALRDSE